MDLLKKSLVALILLAVVVFAWVGTSIYFQKSHINVNPNASSYTKQIGSSFNTDALTDVTTRTGKSFSVSPSQFLTLTQSSN